MADQATVHHHMDQAAAMAHQLHQYLHMDQAAAMVHQLHQYPRMDQLEAATDERNVIMTTEVATRVTEKAIMVINRKNNHFQFRSHFHCQSQLVCSL